MNYKMIYTYDNIDCVSECIPSFRNKTSFEILNCRVQFYILDNPYIIFWVNGDNNSENDAKLIFSKVSKILSFIFAIPFDVRDVKLETTEDILHIKPLISKSLKSKISYIENKVRLFKKTETFFYEVLDLFMVAYDNFFKDRLEDSFIYFFKVMERISKKHYVMYMIKQYKRAKNKSEFTKLINEFSQNNLQVHLTEDLLKNKVDLLYNSIEREFYGSVFNKISLFFTKENININLNHISKIIKLRNKITHGDNVDEEEVFNYLDLCKQLAVQMISIYFFKVDYRKIHVNAYKYETKFDPFKRYRPKKQLPNNRIC